MLCGIILLAAIAAVGASESSCVSVVSTVPVPSTIQSVISTALYVEPSLYTFGEDVEIFTLDQPTGAVALSGIAYYESSYATIISELASIYESPSQYTDLTAVEDITSAYSTLASDVSYIIAAASTQPLSAVYFPDLLTLVYSYPSIISYVETALDISYPSLSYATQVVSEATLIDSSIFGSVVAVETAILTSSTVAYAIDYVSYSVYTLPSTVVTEIVTILSSPSTVGASTVSSLEEYYPTVYYYVDEVTSFLYYYPSVVSDVTTVISVAATVSSLETAVATVIYYDNPTLSYEAVVIASAEYSSPSLSDDLSILTEIMAESPTLSSAEYTIEQSAYESPYIVYSILIALESPSVVSSPTAIASYEATHESVVSAIDTVLSFESYYTSIASTVASVESAVISAFSSYRTLLTAYTLVTMRSSPVSAAASVAFSSAKSVVSDITYVLSDITYVISAFPSDSCYESEIEYYAEIEPTVVSYLWSVYDGYVSVPSSSISYVAELIASYTTLDSAFSGIADEYDYFSSIFTLESSLISAAETDDSILSYYESYFPSSLGWSVYY